MRSKGINIITFASSQKFFESSSLLVEIIRYYLITIIYVNIITTEEFYFLHITGNECLDLFFKPYVVIVETTANSSCSVYCLYVYRSCIPVDFGLFQIW